MEPHSVPSSATNQATPLKVPPSAQQPEALVATPTAKTKMSSAQKLKLLLPPVPANVQQPNNKMRNWSASASSRLVSQSKIPKSLQPANAQKLLKLKSPASAKNKKPPSAAPNNSASTNNVPPRPKPKPAHFEPANNHFLTKNNNTHLKQAARTRLPALFFEAPIYSHPKEQRV